MAIHVTAITTPVHRTIPRNVDTPCAGVPENDWRNGYQHIPATCQTFARRARKEHACKFDRHYEQRQQPSPLISFPMSAEGGRPPMMSGAPTSTAADAGEVVVSGITTDVESDRQPTQSPGRSNRIIEVIE